MKPQASTPTPPKFQHAGVDPRKALLLLGLPVAAAGAAALVLVGSPTLWWIAAGVVAAGTAGTVVLRRSGRAQAAARRLPGVARAGAVMRRMPNGRFARSPLGRAMNRALGRSPAGSRLGGSRAGAAGGRPGGLGARLRAALPSWAGGTRGRGPAARPRTAGSVPAGSRSGGRVRSALSRLMPGGRRRAATAGSATRSAAGRPGGRTPGAGAGGRPQSRAARAWSRITAPFRPGKRPTGTPSARRPPAGNRTKPSRIRRQTTPRGKNTTAGTDAALTTARTRLGKVRRLVGKGVGSLFGRLRKRKTADPADDFDPNSTYEIGIEGEVIDGKHTDAELGRIAERAKQQAAARVAEAARLAKKRAKKSKKAEPEWPNVEPHDGSWPTTEPEDGTAPPAPARELPADRDRDPPPSPPVSPPPHREKKREAPRITSTNTGGRAMAISPTKYNDLITNAPSRAEGFRASADAFRRDSASLDGEAKDHEAAAAVFEQAGNYAEAENRREHARKLRDDANTCLTYAAKHQERANSTANGKAPAA